MMMACRKEFRIDARFSVQPWDPSVLEQANRTETSKHPRRLLRNDGKCVRVRGCPGG